MTIDPEYLRNHYAQLTDQALLSVNRADLVEAAQQCYDEELRRRKLPSPRAKAEPRPSPESKRVMPKASTDSDAAADPPDWLEDAAEVYAFYAQADSPALGPTEKAVEARDALEAAGIPCYLDFGEVPKEVPRPTHLWRLMVPGDLNIRAGSVLERDIHNAEFEAGWKAHLEALSDVELAATNPQESFCGLFDRVERVQRAFEEEQARRSL